MASAFASPYCVGAGLAKLAAEVGQALDKSGGAAECAKGEIKAALQRFLLGDDLITGELPAAPLATYRQELSHLDPAGRFSIAALIWLPGHRTPVHDHRCWCCFGWWRGREVETLRMRNGSGTLGGGKEHRVLPRRG